MMLPPICVKCRVQMRCKKNDYLVADKASQGFPETYWLGDLWGCPQCGQQIVTGFGQPFTECPQDYRPLVFDQSAGAEA